MVKKNKTLSVLKKEGGQFALLIIAAGLALIMFPLGLFYSLLLKPLYHIFTGDPAYAGKRWLKYFGNFFYQVWSFIKTLFYFIAYLIDVLANVFVGEMIEDVITPVEDTMLGRGDNVTISVALGDIERKAKRTPSKMNGVGHWLLRQLNRFESNHANKSIRRWDFKQKLKKEN